MGISHSQCTNYNGIHSILKVCRVYGFVTKENPMIYRNDGKLIGNSQQFFEFILQNFDVDINSYDATKRNSDVKLHKLG